MNKCQLLNLEYFYGYFISFNLFPDSTLLGDYNAGVNAISKEAFLLSFEKLLETETLLKALLNVCRTPDVSCSVHRFVCISS